MIRIIIMKIIIDNDKKIIVIIIITIIGIILIPLLSVVFMQIPTLIGCLKHSTTHHKIPKTTLHSKILCTSRKRTNAAEQPAMNLGHSLIATGKDGKNRLCKKGQ